MIDLHFQSYLNKQSIEEIRQVHGFRDSLPLEKFIMDFEVLTHIQQVLPDCVVKGGMATPFHLNDKKLQRLSVDIDLVTASSRDQVIKAMETVSNKLADVIKIGDPYVPRNKPNKKLPLLTYYCDYQSSIDDNPEIKIEIFYGNDMKIQSKKINNNIEIIGILINFPLSIYEHGSLIGDKLTTLPFNTIGIDSNREIDVPKQIYDIATLLKSLPNPVPMRMIIDTFEKISKTEISYFKGTKPSVDDVLKDLANFSETLLIDENQIKLNPHYAGRFATFKTTMLGNVQYLAHAHVADILLIKTIIKLILKKFNGAKLETITKKATQVLVGLTTISNMNTNDKNTESKKIRAKYGKSSNVGKIMRDLFPEQVYLYDQLIEIDLIPTA